VNARNLLFGILGICLAAAAFVYLFLPANAQENRPMPKLSTDDPFQSRKDPRVPFAGVTAPRFGSPEPPMAMIPNVTESPSVSGLNRLLKLAVEFERQKAELKDKEAEIVRQEAALALLKKQKADLAANVANISKDMAKGLGDYKQTFEKPTEPSQPRVAPNFPVTPPPANQATDADAAKLTEVLLKLNALDQRLRTIEQKLTPRTPRDVK
jgi:hypothetical protein